MLLKALHDNLTDMISYTNAFYDVGVHGNKHIFLLWETFNVGVS